MRILYNKQSVLKNCVADLIDEFSHIDIYSLKFDETGTLCPVQIKIGDEMPPLEKDGDKLPFDALQVDIVSPSMDGTRDQCELGTYILRNRSDYDRAIKNWNEIVEKLCEKGYVKQTDFIDRFFFEDEDWTEEDWKDED